MDLSKDGYLFCHGFGYRFTVDGNRLVSDALFAREKAELTRNGFLGTLCTMDFR